MEQENNHHDEHEEPEMGDQDSFPDTKFLKLRIDCATSDSISTADHSVTLNVYTPTVTPMTQFDEEKEFPNIIPPQLDAYNTINSNYISNLSLSSAPNTPFLGNNLSLSSAPSNNLGSRNCILGDPLLPSNTPQFGSNHNSTNSLSAVTLDLSETCLTPNMAATDCTNSIHMPPNTLILNDNDFSLNSVETSLEQKMNENEDKIIFVNPHPRNSKLLCEDACTKEKTLFNMRGIPENESLKKLFSPPPPAKISINLSAEPSVSNQHHHEEKMCMVQDEDDMSVSHTIVVDEILMDSEKMLLQKRGYKLGKKLAETLQGAIYECVHIKSGEMFVLKRTNKWLHKRGITIQDGKRYNVKENILKEKNILEKLTRRGSPSFMIKYIDFFESDEDYYLLMEHGGRDLFEFIIEAHELIQSGKLTIKEWRKFTKFVFWQMSVLLLWLHNTAKACHLDVSLENILIKNARFLDKGNGKVSIATDVQIKFCDLGLAEFFDKSDSFMCKKFVGKTNYKSPQVYNKKRAFDARKADVWSLGVVLFSLAVGAPPYKRPSMNDDCYNDFIANGLIANLLYTWKRHTFVTERMLSLLSGMLDVNEEKRFSMDDILKHPWLRTYFKRYHHHIQNDLL